MGATDDAAMRGHRNLTAYQRDIWLVTQLFPGVPSYVVGLQARLVGDVDIDVLTDCYARAWERHDGIRLRFGVTEGMPYQELADDMPPIEHVDLTGQPDPAAAADRIVQEAVGTAIDPTERVPLRVTLLREAEQVYRVLVFSHHVAIDATGVFNLAAHVLADYSSVMATGRPAPLPATSFREAAELADEYLQSEQWLADRDYLTDQIGDATPALFDRSHAVTGPAPLRRHRCHLPRSFVDRLRDLDVPFFPYLATVVGTYVSRVLRTDDVMVGIPLSNRNTPAEMMTVGGHFANTLPLRIDRRTGAGLADLVGDVRGRVREIKARQRFPLGDLMNELRRTGRDTGPLFDVTVTYVRLPEVHTLSDIVESVEGLPQGFDTLTLAVHVHELDNDGPLELIFDYATDVFDDDYPIESVERHLKALLDAGLESLQADPATLPMLSATELAALTEQSRGPVVPYDDRTSVIERIMTQAQATPDAAAVLAADAPAMTYSQLNQRISAMAADLRARGVHRGDRVAVLLERGPDMVVAVMAAMHAGAAYVPVDPHHPADRIAYVLADAGVAAVLTDDAARPGIGDLPVIPMHGGQPSPAPAPNPSVPTGPDLAYVIYTSGSTGTPKGVAVEHHSVINRLDWMQRRYPIGPGDVILQKTPITFDVSVWELFWWAMQGAAVALLPPGGQQDPAEILRAISESRVTVLHFVPSMLTPFLDLLEQSPGAAEQADSLRLVFCSGEALRPHQVNRFNRMFAHRGTQAPTLVNLYGPTEACVDVSFHDLPADPDRPVSRVPIGRPIDNTRLYVLGRSDEPQPVGVPGELCIAGAGLARGYLNRPQLQEDRFVADPFHPGERMYRTGDLARWCSAGQLEYLGRIDRQVKVRGNRVEPGEIENALTDIPGILDAVVVADESESRGTYLVAFYLATAEFDAGMLRARLAQRVPDYLVPAQFCQVETIPVTSSGKADRAALLATARRQSTVEHVEPRTDIEAALVEVWQQVLDIPVVSIHDNFFDLGGDSILSLRVRALAEARGLLLDARDIAHHPTVSELARQVVAGADATPPVAPFELVSAVDRAHVGDAADAYPLTRLQLGMLFHSTEQHDSQAYHDVFRYQLRMPWQESAWRIALERLVARHPALRTSFHLAGFTEPLQLVHPHVDADCDIVDLRDRETRYAHAVIETHLADRRAWHYELGRPGLCHFGVFLLPDRVDVVFSFHHAILDGWSVSAILAELLQDYRHAGGAAVEPVASAALPCFAEYVRAEQIARDNPEDREYWTRLLADAPAIRIPGDRHHVEAGEADGIASAAATRLRHTVQIPESLCAQVSAAAGDEHVPAKAVYLAAHLFTVGRFAGQQDVTSGVVTHGRPQRANAERTAGLFLNTVPVRVNTTAPSWRALVRDVFDQDRANAAHAHYPLADIQRHADLALDVAFNYVNFHQAGDLLAALDVELLDVDADEATNFALLVNVLRDPRDGSVTVRLDGDPAMYTSEQLDVLGRSFVQALQFICTEPDSAVGIAADAQIAAVTATVGTGTVVERFVASASRFRDDVALEFGSRTVTYGELDAMSARLAAGLVLRGVRQGDRVAVSAQRGPELIAAVLGIARAGAACVPVDPAYPAVRRDAMLAVAQPVAVLGDALIAELLTGPTAALPTVHPDQPAYVLFTSGSTGVPKGVVMAHRALANLIDWQLSVPSGRCADTGRAPATLQFAPLSFDVSFQEIYSTLCGAGRLLLITDAGRRDLPTLVSTLDATATERIILPYVALQPLAEAAVARGAAPGALRIIVSSGEQLRVTDEIRALCTALARNTGDVILENQYGPTETHVVTYHRMTGNPHRFPTLPPVGTPIDNVAIAVLDARGQAVPDGVPGEIWVVGAALADGYLGRPDLTDEAFLDVESLGGLRMYRTGDLGRRLPDGRLVVEGRRGTAVKVRGHRIEPLDVELALGQVAARRGVTEVAVVARPSGESSARTQLVAFLVGPADDALAAGIAADLRDVVPEYMVPSRFEWLDELPHTPSGKRADAALATMVLAAPAGDHIEPRDEHERVIAELMADALGVARIGAFDEFFALGGDSISAVRLIVGIERRFGTTVPMSAFGARPTVAELAAHVRDRDVVAFDPVVALKPTGDRPPLFLVHPIGGSVLCYAELAAHLPEDQPLYALQAAGLEPGTAAVDDLQRLAADYIQAVRRIQPDGPYHIGGWSLGGLIAFEMAHQLAGDGAEVGSLVLLDTMALDPDSATDLTPTQLYSYFLWELLWGALGTGTPTEPVPDVDSDDAALDYILDVAISRGVLPRTGSRELVRRLLTVFRCCWQAGAQYRPAVWPGSMTLLRAGEALPEVLTNAHDAAGSCYRHADNGWGRWVAGQLTVVEVPGDHLTMVIQPHVTTLATTLTEHLVAQPDYLGASQ
ncbi:amino acid adenylation domain-containing protein [Mycobacterium frederiksbergense]|uniref:Amino acid adenylation domain-containing protein n=1 Tax=Mycolicibacterium frederiksbergense TaxID=117567 RepID=A0ABT6L301_9MYCO|nr:non-ribosomal peptide synthetase [Mycolicibacterium frederiksbergense]MDH6197317.1 amino acid adenylation domain-containing protein [Mycolicibacterium frederiksbergense]